MMTYLGTQFETKDRHFRTTLEDGTYADWYTSDGKLRVQMFRVANDDSPARIWPDDPLPACPNGHVTFRYKHPVLADARERFPDLVKLWDAVEAEYLTALAPTQQNSCHDGRSFTPEEHAAWLRSLQTTPTKRP
jgi:hypothetical protein